MASVAVGSLLVLCGIALMVVAVWMAVRLAVRADAVVPPSPAPVADPPAVPVMPMPPSPPLVRIRWVNAQGVSLGDSVILAADRKVTMTRPYPKGGRIGQFVADRHLPSGVWIYRWTGDERV